MTSDLLRSARRAAVAVGRRRHDQCTQAANDEIRLITGLFDEAKAGQCPQQCNRDLQLQSSQRGTDAEMKAATESDVSGVAAGGIEPVRVGKP